MASPAAKDSSGWTASKLYLVAYNGAMCLGWGAILTKIGLHYAAGGAPGSLYEQIALPLIVFQTGAVTEIAHAACGLVRSGVMTTVMQVLSRLLVLYGAVEIGESDARRSPFFTQMVVAWGLSEVIRYSYYIANIVGVNIGALTYLRYSAFLVLYPVGITGEIIALVKALPYIKAERPWSIEMPNSVNFTFSWYNCVWFILLGVYPMGSYVMYSHMWRQRVKTLAKAKAAAVAAKKTA